MKKYTIAFDLDGVVVDLVTALLGFLSSECGRKISYGDINCYDIGVALNLGDRMHKIWAQAYQGEVLLNAKPVAGAIEGLNKLEGHRIIFVTSRPAFVKSKTESWLNKYNVRYEKIYFDVNKNELVQGEDIDLLIEDCLEHAVNIALKGVKTILLNQPWNQTSDLPNLCKRVNSWDEIMVAVQCSLRKADLCN
jgi:uncharacterized HAD superfamily protein